MASEPRKKSAESPRILIVDDDAGQRSLLDSFLRSQGFEPVVVDSGKLALEMLRAGKFDMMISDVRMPGLTGLETLRQARKEHATLPDPARHRLHRRARRRGRDARRRGQLSCQAD